MFLRLTYMLTSELRWHKLCLSQLSFLPSFSPSCGCPPSAWAVTDVRSGHSEGSRRAYGMNLKGCSQVRSRSVSMKGFHAERRIARMRAHTHWQHFFLKSELTKSPQRELTFQFFLLEIHMVIFFPTVYVYLSTSCVEVSVCLYKITKWDPNCFLNIFSQTSMTYFSRHIILRGKILRNLMKPCGIMGAKI